MQGFAQLGPRLRVGVSDQKHIAGLQIQQMRLQDLHLAHEGRIQRAVRENDHKPVDIKLIGQDHARRGHGAIGLRQRLG